MICRECAKKQGGKAKFIATTMQKMECPECGERKLCCMRYKYGLPDKTEEGKA